MTAALDLGLFVKLDGLWQSDKFAKNSCFDYLGKNLESWLLKVLKELGVSHDVLSHSPIPSSAFVQGPVYIAENVHIEPTAFIQGPCIIGPGAEIRHGAYIRGNAWIGAKAVVGHTTEVKGSVFFDGAKAGHFAYVGDSILGAEVNLGAGTKLANLKLRGSEVSIKHPVTGEMQGSGLRKMSAILGDHAQTGCNSVLSPGTLLMPGTAVLPCVHYHGTLLKGLAR